MSKKSTRADNGTDDYPDDWVVMHFGEAAPPGVPLGETCVLPFEQIKHLLTDRPMARYGELVPRSPKLAKYRRARRRPRRKRA